MARAHHFVASVALVTEECCNCHTVFAMSRELYDRLQAKTGTTFYCPRGHAQHYVGKSQADELADSKARELALQDQLSAAIRDSEATKAALLRDRARFAAGVCPCCNRSFENVRRHMVTKHPDYDVTRIAHNAPVFKCSCGRKFTTFQGLRTHQGHRRRTTGTYRWDKPKQDRYWAHLTEVTV